jgi:hypothetical protein
MSVTLLVISSLLIQVFLPLCLCVTTLGMKIRHHNTSKPPHDLLASWALLLVRETQLRVHF